ncbi:MAG: hypothetical protein VX617_07660 [Pseudomonadota bacterium]|nr:hypothetical protein [Pseudomonadota bacterium]
MDDQKTKTKSNSKLKVSQKAATREERLVAALRDNLKRRKRWRNPKISS